RGARDAARQDLGVLEDVLLQQLHILVVDVLDAVRAELADLAAAEEDLLFHHHLTPPAPCRHRRAAAAPRARRCPPPRPPGTAACPCGRRDAGPRRYGSRDSAARARSG